MEPCIRAGGPLGDDPADLAVEYNIVEIFHSVQGEGFHAGIPMCSFGSVDATSPANGATPILIPMKP